MSSCGVSEEGAIKQDFHGAARQRQEPVIEEDNPAGQSLADT